MIRGLMVAAAVGSAGVGGVFFAFSSFVMAGLSRLPAANGIAAMQAINATAVRPALLTALFGTAGACTVLVVHAGVSWDDRGSLLVVVGGGLYLVGVLGTTVAFHVPRNEALALVEPMSAAAADLWSSYVRQWSAGNHVRTVAGLAASVALTAALLS